MAAADGAEPEELECDYLVVGAGARGLAFVDALLEEAEEELSVFLVDEHHEPGGHWNDAYTFARLHQPSHYYGVVSRYLENRQRRPGGAAERAAREEVLLYFAGVLDELVDTGVVRYFPMCSVGADGTTIASRLDPDSRWKVSVRRKLVDTAFLSVEVPATRLPPFDVQAGAVLVPPNWISSLPKEHPSYTVIGAGRTGIDTVLWLLSRCVKPDQLQWVVPRDAWFFCREAMEPEQVGATWRTFLELAAASPSIDALCLDLEKAGIWCRLDETVRQECFHGAFVSRDELQQLQRVSNVVRMGHVREVRLTSLQLEAGSVPADPATLYIDCCGSWERCAPRPVPIWEGQRIKLQQVEEASGCTGGFNVPFSASLIGFMEAVWPEDDEMKNSLCTPAAMPDSPEQWLRAQLQALRRRGLWRHERAAEWLRSSRPGLLAVMSEEESEQLVGEAARPLQERAAHNLDIILRQHAAGVSRKGEVGSVVDACAVMLWAFARLNACHEGLFARAMGLLCGNQRLREEIHSQGIANLLWAFARYSKDVQDSSAHMSLDVLAALLPTLTRLLPKLNSVEISSSVWAISKLVPCWGQHPAVDRILVEAAKGILAEPQLLKGMSSPGAASLLSAYSDFFCSSPCTPQPCQELVARLVEFCVNFAQEARAAQVGAKAAKGPEAHEAADWGGRRLMWATAARELTNRDAVVEPVQGAPDLAPPPLRGRVPAGWPSVQSDSGAPQPQAIRSRQTAAGELAYVHPRFATTEASAQPWGSRHPQLELPSSMDVELSRQVPRCPPEVGSKLPAPQVPAIRIVEEFTSRNEDLRENQLVDVAVKVADNEVNKAACIVVDIFANFGRQDSFVLQAEDADAFGMYKLCMPQYEGRWAVCFTLMSAWGKAIGKPASVSFLSKPSVTRLKSQDYLSTTSSCAYTDADHSTCTGSTHSDFSDSDHDQETEVHILHQRVM